MKTVIISILCSLIFLCMPPVMAQKVDKKPTKEKPVYKKSITEKRLTGDTLSHEDSARLLKEKDAKSFFKGIHPSPNAAQTFDSASVISGKSMPVYTPPVELEGVNDTTVNVNTINQQGTIGVSGTTDRSAANQFGQTNWNRNTVGESQWTVPPPISTSFNTDFGSPTDVSWSRNMSDTSLYRVQYQSNAQWVTVTYNAMGQRLDTRTEIPLVQAPRAVTVYSAKQPPGFKIFSIHKLNIPGRPDMYEVRAATGDVIYLNTDGIRVKL